MRADDIARGGLRMLRITKSNYSAELDKLTLLNFALGPKAQRIKPQRYMRKRSKRCNCTKPNIFQMQDGSPV